MMAVGDDDVDMTQFQFEEPSIICKHIKKSINGNIVRSLKKDSNEKFALCKGCLTMDDNLFQQKLKAEEPVAYDHDVKGCCQSLCICMFCGYFGCGRYNLAHGVEHYEKRRQSSVEHRIVYQVFQGKVWCYECDAFIDTNDKKSGKAREVFEQLREQILPLIKKRYLDFEHPLNKKDEDDAILASGVEEGSSVNEEQVHLSGDQLQHSEIVGTSAQTNSHLNKSDQPANDSKYSHLLNSKKANSETITTRQGDALLLKNRNNFAVQGLQNLGNTCFYNSTLQNIAQLKPLIAMLHLVSNYPMKFNNLKLKPRKFTSAIDKEMKDLPAISIVLPKPDKREEPITNELGAFLLDYHSRGNAHPGALLNAIRQKHRQFYGWAQQDSHELLRCLLDGARTEEQKRYQSAIQMKLCIKSVGTDRVGNPKFRPEDKETANAYLNAADTLVDRVFGGLLLQTIQCTQCQHVSTRLEPFFDLSLPIADKEKCLDQQTRVAQQRRRSKPPQAKPESDDSDDTDEASSRAKDVSQLRETVLALYDEFDYMANRSKSPLEAAASDVKRMSISEECMDHDGLESEKLLTTQHRIENEQKSFQRLLEPMGLMKDTKNNECSIDTCLQLFTAVELLHGSNQFGCTNCLQIENSRGTTSNAALKERNKSGGSSDANNNDRMDILAPTSKISLKRSKNLEAKEPKYKFVDADKKYMIFRPPPILTIHLKRFQKSGWSLRKNSRRVDFPEVLDLAPYTCQHADLGRMGDSHLDDTEFKLPYVLSGVVVHSGGMGGGHYIAHVRAQPKSQEMNKEFTDAMKEALRHVSCSTDENHTSLMAADEVDIGLFNDILEKKHRVPTPDFLIDRPTGVLSVDKLKEGDWFYISDSHVSPSSLERALAAEAYVLFYIRV